MACAIPKLGLITRQLKDDKADEISSNDYAVYMEASSIARVPSLLTWTLLSTDCRYLEATVYWSN